MNLIGSHSGLPKAAAAPSKQLTTMDRAALTALNRAGDAAYQAVEKVNAELLTLTYGALVAQLCADLEDVGAVNAQLDTLGYNLGLRLADDFLARTRLRRCRTFAETAEATARVGFKTFRPPRSRAARAALTRALPGCVFGAFSP